MILWHELNPRVRCALGNVYIYYLSFLKGFVVSHLFSSHLVHWQLKNISNISQSTCWFRGWKFMNDLTHSHKWKRQNDKRPISPHRIGWAPNTSWILIQELANGQFLVQKIVHGHPYIKLDKWDLNVISCFTFTRKGSAYVNHSLHHHFKSVISTGALGEPLSMQCIHKVSLFQIASEQFKERG